MFFLKSRITAWFSIVGTFPRFSRFSDACGRAFLWRTGACIVYKSTFDFDFDPTIRIRSRSNGLTDDYFYILFICFSLNKSFECLISELLTIFELFIIYRFIPQDLTWRNINARKKLTALKIYSTNPLWSLQLHVKAHHQLSVNFNHALVGIYFGKNSRNL